MSAERPSNCLEGWHCPSCHNAEGDSYRVLGAVVSCDLEDEGTRNVGEYRFEFPPEAYAACNSCGYRTTVEKFQKLGDYCPTCDAEDAAKSNDHRVQRAMALIEKYSDPEDGETEHTTHAVDIIADMLHLLAHHKRQDHPGIEHDETISCVEERLEMARMHFVEEYAEEHGFDPNIGADGEPIR